MTTVEQPASVGIIGGGLIGASWAALAAAHGHQVYAWDPAPAARDSFQDRVVAARAQLAILGLTSNGEVALLDRLQDVAAQCTWIQENAPERVDLKRQLLAEIEAAAGSEAIIASSTSSLLWSDLARDLRHPDRFILAHPF